ncbi:hypothetical protein SLA2020_188520 [Shorea laevis]
MSLSEALVKDEENRSRSAILFAQIALFTATIFWWKTRLYAEHDRTGFKTALSYQIIAILVSCSRNLSDKLDFIHKKCDPKVNSIANLICLILAIVLEKFYEKSLSSLGFAFSITVLLLILLVIIRPSTDLGLFGFLIGVIGSVAHDLFGLKFQTWIVVAICFPLLGFRFWLDKYWLESQRRSRSRRGRNHKPEIIEALMLTGFRLFWVYNLFRTNCQAIKGPPKPICCTSSSVMEILACVLIIGLIPLVNALLREPELEHESRPAPSDVRPRPAPSDVRPTKRIQQTQRKED